MAKPDKRKQCKNRSPMAVRRHRRHDQTLRFEYIALNPGASYRGGCTTQLVNYGENDPPMLPASTKRSPCRSPTAMPAPREADDRHRA